MSTWGDLQRLDAQRPMVLDCALALGIAAAALLSVRGDVAPLQLGLILAAAGCYALRRRYPLAVLLMAGALVFTMIALGYSTAVIGAGLFLLAYTVAAHRSARVTVIAAGYCLLVLVAVSLAFPGRMPWEAFGTNLALFVGAFTLGRASGLHRRTARLEQDRADLTVRMQQETTRRAVTEERLRIARELHDVVGHSLGVIALQAGVCARIVESDPAETKTGLLAIAARSRASLQEVRQILGTMREPDDSTGPLPGLTEAGAALFADFVAAGLRVEVERTGTPWPLSPALDHAAYRVLQESLTNVLRHAATDRAWVTIAFTPQLLELTVRDRGVGGEGPAGAGQLGMRERVASRGGTLRFGPAPDGGYRVIARLPREEQP